MSVTSDKVTSCADCPAGGIGNKRCKIDDESIVEQIVGKVLPADCPFGFRVITDEKVGG